MTYLFDTDFCIDVIRGRRPDLRARFASLPLGAAGISAISYGELSHGARKGKQRAAAEESLLRFAALVPVLALDRDAGRHYGDIRADLETRGLVIGNNDLWIAAHARSRGLTLITANQREFGRVPGLQTEDWRNP